MEEIPSLWVPDEVQDGCFNCKTIFTTFNRRHHCRYCRLIFCENCSKNNMPLYDLGLNSPQRLCDNCFRFCNDIDSFRSKYAPVLMGGETFKKHGKNWGFSAKTRWIQCNKNYSICWYSARENTATSLGKIDLEEITEVIDGASTQVFARNGINQGSDLAKLCFSIVGATRTLDLISLNQESKNQWMTALKQYLALRSKQFIMKENFQKLLTVAIKNSTGYKDPKVLQTMNNLNKELYDGQYGIVVSPNLIFTKSSSSSSSSASSSSSQRSESSNSINNNINNGSSNSINNREALLKSSSSANLLASPSGNSSSISSSTSSSPVATNSASATSAASAAQNAVNALEERGQSIQHLNDRTAALNISAQQFYQSSKELRQRYE